ncbi:hypothetical protein EK21DRAFT_70824 [Setomelanomma holmii]|uniref:Uncharacterized protein n=1 Tax=Setomelanomma holmii TaxID=210430 RepID=A0A9P4H4C0_9PLEO|nr:hypothetical protein EK21DRAFT_70824 [Setomelanomma holmii]
MPEDCLSDTDKIFISNYAKSTERLAKQQPWRTIPRCRTWISTATQQLYRREQPTVSHRKFTRAQREEALTRFILALSDQQLVVGLAILIAAIIGQCTLSVSEFQVAFALAWFSTTTHFATLDSLRQYFKHHETIRNWRIFGMFVLMILFLYCFAIILFTTGLTYWDSYLQSKKHSAIVQCYLERDIRMALVDGLLVSRLDLLLVLPWILTFLLLVVGYKNRIFQSFGLITSGSCGAGIVSAKIEVALSKKSLPGLRDLTSATLVEWKAVLDEAAKEQWSETHRRLLQTIKLQSAVSSRSPSNIKALWALLSQQAVVENMYRNSLLPVAPLLTFMLTYGFTRMINYRWMQAEFEDVASMGFGQITPLFLLVLPVLAAAEIYYESVGDETLKSPHADSNDLPAVPTGALELTAVPRTDTLPCTSSADARDPFLAHAESMNRRYDESLDLVQRYFLRKSKHIAIKCSETTDETVYKAAIRLKANTWAITKQLSSTEEKVNPHRWIRVQCYTWTLVAFSSAVLLNILGNLAVAGGTILFLQCINIILHWISDYRDADLEAYIRLLSDVREKS